MAHINHPVPDSGLQSPNNKIIGQSGAVSGNPGASGNRPSGSGQRSTASGNPQAGQSGRIDPESGTQRTEQGSSESGDSESRERESHNRATSSDHVATVFIIEPEFLFRQMLSTAIEQLGHFRVVGTAPDFTTAEEIIERRPEILITEMFIAGKTLSSLIEQIRPLADNTKVLILSRASDQAISRQMQQLPAHGYVSKQEDPEKLYQTLELLRLNKEISAEGTTTAKGGFEASYDDPIACLSPREREIFQLLADGFQNTVIAKKLFISPRTVETHRARVVRKLGLTSNGDLIRFAIKHGLSNL